MSLHRLTILYGAAVLASIVPAPCLAQEAMGNSHAALHTYAVNAENGSKESGTVSLATAGAGSTRVIIALTGAPLQPQPAHIHHGACPNVGTVAYALKDVVNGKSTTVVKASLASLIAGGYAVNIHKSASAVASYAACGDLGTAMRRAPAASGSMVPPSSGAPMPVASGPPMPVGSGPPMPMTTRHAM